MPRIRPHVSSVDLSSLSLGRNSPWTVMHSDKVKRDKEIETGSKHGAGHLRVLSTYVLYRRRPCRIENMCGKLACLVDKRQISSVLVKSRMPMGMQENVYNVYGNGTFMSNTPDVLHFKGCQNTEGVYSLAESLGIQEHPKILVRMVVISACTGCYMDVSHRGAVCKILTDFGIKPIPGMESCNPVRFYLSRNNWVGTVYPKNNDWTVTTRGSVIARMTFDFIEWDNTVEKDILDCCEHMTNLLIDSVESVAKSD